MINFSNTTLVMVDGMGTEFEINDNIILKTLKFTKFQHVVHFTANLNKKSKNYEIVYCRPLSYYDYQCFCIYAINSHITSDFALYMQNDGFIINPEHFDPEYFNYDYIGGPFPAGIFKNPKYNKIIVGNGGFSLRSKRLLTLAQQIPNVNCNEDTLITIKHKKLFEKMGCKFAPIFLAKKFSLSQPLDNTHTLKNSFGFHGKNYVEEALKILEKNSCV